MSDQRNLGQYMTPYFLAEQLVRCIKSPPESWRILDPSCGDGNLLLAARRAIESVSGFRNAAMLGIEIDEQMAAVSRLRLSNSLVQCEIRNQDFFNSADLIKEFNPNVIIANPPYGKSREYRFFEACAELASPGCEIIFLVPLAFMDRVKIEEFVTISGKPFGVTTGHAIGRHTSGRPYQISGTRENQSNPTQFTVHSGVKLYEVGMGIPVQTQQLLANKPYSSGIARPGWLPCVRTGDIAPFRVSLTRLFVDYGPQLAHPKNLSTFTGPRLFVRRVPMYNPRTLGSAFLDVPALCAGDVLVVRHRDNDVVALRDLEIFLNSEEALLQIYESRPSVGLRDSYPKIAAKDLNVLLARYGLASLVQEDTEGER